LLASWPTSLGLSGRWKYSLRALRERADSQQERSNSQQERTETQQERIDLAARELAEVSDRLQAAANAPSSRLTVHFANPS